MTSRRPIVVLAALLFVVVAVGCHTTIPHPGASPILRYVRDPGFPVPSGITFSTVSWIAVDAETRLVWLLQRGQPAVTVWHPDGRLVSRWNTDMLGDPHSITLVGTGAQKSVWITDMAPPNPTGPAFGHCLKQFDRSGTFLGSIGVCGEQSQGSGLDPVQFDKVTHVMPSAAGKLLVTDGDIGGLNNRALTFSPSGQVLANWSAPFNRPGSGPREFNLPHAVAIDTRARAWIADTLNHRVQVSGLDGTYFGAMTAFDQDGVYGIGLGPVVSTQAERAALVYVTTSPTTGGSGTAFVFRAVMDCARPARFDAQLLTSWPVSFPSSPPGTSPVAMLHAIAVDPVSGDLYFAPLGTNLPPQKWTPLR
jgi:hypothetical protein